MRVQKFLSLAGVLSRRAAEEAILAGRVSVNGVTLKALGQTLVPEMDEVRLDGKLVKILETKKTYLFYKPRGVMTTKSDPEGRPTVMDYFKDEPALNPVGRLDFDSEGLLLMTHDGDLLLKLTHPRYEVKKVYEVWLDRKCATSELSALITSVELSDGPGHFNQIRHLKDHCYEVTVSEGRNRFVRRMFGAFGFQVVRLKRTKMGDYELGSLKPGERKEWPTP